MKEKEEPKGRPFKYGEPMKRVTYWIPISQVEGFRLVYKKFLEKFDKAKKKK